MDKQARATERSIDTHIGNRVRNLRLDLGMNQTQLAEPLGLTFQQVQKMERGINRISAGRLVIIARLFGVPVGWFFTDLPTGKAVKPVSLQTTLLTASFDNIDDANVRLATYKLVRALGRK